MSQKGVNYFLYTGNKSKVVKALKESNIDQGAFSKIGFVDEFFYYLHINLNFYKNICFKDNFYLLFLKS